MWRFCGLLLVPPPPRPACPLTDCVSNWLHAFELCAPASQAPVCMFTQLGLVGLVGPWLLICLPASDCPLTYVCVRLL